MPKFRITDGKGFQITFENGYTVSVQFGPCTYSDHHDATFDDNYDAGNRACGEKGSSTAETAVWKDAGPLITLEGDSDSVQGYQTPEQVLALLNWAASQKGGNNV